QNQLLFASEIKGILAYPGFPREVDPEAFYHYLSFYYVSAPRSIYRHIRRLPAGCRMLVESGKIRIERYWDLNFQPDPARSYEDWVEEFRSVFEASVGRHLQSDVPLGVYLSGGLDSSAIVAAVSRIASSVRTYSIGYEESSYSELKEARLTATR